MKGDEQRHGACDLKFQELEADLSKAKKRAGDATRALAQYKNLVQDLRRQIAEMNSELTCLRNEARTRAADLKRNGSPVVIDRGKIEKGKRT